MNYSKKISILFIALFVSGFLLTLTPVAHAMTPTLSVSNDNNGDSATVTVNGDPNVSVLFYYIKSGVGLTPTSSNWTTNSSGYFSTSISTSSYQITPSSSVYITTGGLNGAQSNSVVWPISSGTVSSNTISLSQTGVVLTVGNSTSVTASGVSSLYLSNNSNPPIANINVSGNSITIAAIARGSTVATVCSTASTSTCTSIYVTVQNSGTQALTFGQSNVTIVPGQNVPISITGGNGVYIVQNNPNSAVQASISGSTITLSTTATTGSSSLTVCSSDLSSCGIINVTVGTASSTALSFSPTNPTVAIGQGTSVAISGASGAVYYVSSNSNPSVAQVSISSNIITIIGNTSGSTVLSICSSTGSCGSFTATINYVSSGGTISLSQTSMTILVGQTLSVVISGGTAPYNVINNSPNIAQTTVNGNILTVYGAVVGTEVIPVCSAGGGCISLSVLVNGSATTTSLLTLGQTSLSLIPGQSTTVSISGSGTYYISSNSNSAVANVQVSGSSLIVTSIANGIDNVSVCQSNGQCATLIITVAATVAPTTSTTSTATPYVFPRALAYGENGSDILFLQQYLAGKGYLSAAPNGHYGPATVEAVKKLQLANGIKQTGSVGPITKNFLNQLQIPSGSVTVSSSSNATSKQQQVAQLQALLQQIEAQIAALQ